VPDHETLELAALVLIALGGLLFLLDRVFNRRAPQDPEARRRGHASAARKSTNLALVCVALLVVALLLGRVLLGAMAVVGLVVFVGVAVVRGRLSR